MKYCPECNRQYSEAWLTFCTQDGSLLREDLTPAADPNWDPRIRETKYDDPAEQETQWLPRDPQPGSGWMAPEQSGPVERSYQPPAVERPWQPPAPPYRPQSKPPPPGIAIASFVVGIIGVMMGLACWMPVPGVVAVILGLIALSQMKTAPNPTGRGLAIAGIIMGGVNLAFFVFGILWLFLSLIFG
ncbi:MAG TPA: DUF4190 domain-containing protein [Pyrinomonadaceae bacterium]|nr:DUF4190 domain-containing protein [Pyrinomonadaceae bacterium]